ncbi:unnamed protein product [Allacma fusca]|uniref:Uncharacterized protein n=1 Tax=Allacma fusca TaxID=39272 RepID=A0A8J2PIL1_9HEXA|nr:unnamed protein product [Allacma fusca]
MEKIGLCSQILVLIVILYCPHSVVGKGQYVMPLLGGMKMSLSYDIANLFLRPVASFLSVFVSIAMLFILFFGIITAPFGYAFGIPSRKYVLGGQAGRSMDFQFFNSSSLSLSDDTFFPTFEDQVFYLLPKDLQTEPCQQLALCHAHNVVTKLPPSILKSLRIFSEKLVQLSDNHKEAIMTGIKFQEDCTEVYTLCKDSGFSILGKTLLYWLPKSLKNHQYRRKRAMYM